MDTLKQLLLQDEACSSMQSDDEKWSSVMAACHNGCSEAVSLLLQATDADVNMQTKTGWTYLLEASSHGHTEVVSQLLQKDAHVDIQNHEGWSPLMVASQNGYIEIVTLLLGSGAHVNMQNGQNWTSLMSATHSTHREIVLLLLQNGANVNMQTRIGWSCLIDASSHGHTGIVSLLLQEGANVDMQDNEGQNSLMIASHEGYAETVALLLQNNALVNMQDHDGRSALMRCCEKTGDDLACSQLLIGGGADINLQTTTDNEQLTALIIAIANGNTNIALNLIDRGANTSIKAKWKSSALILASQFNQIEVADRILNQKAFYNEIDHQDDFGNTALIVASVCGHDDMVKLLLYEGAEVDIHNTTDYPTLHHPLQKIQLPEEDDISFARGGALDIAVMRGHVEIVSHLLEYKAKVHNIFYLLRSIILKRARVDSTAIKLGSSGDADWDKYRTILQLLFSNDSDLIGQVHCNKPNILYIACAFGVLEMASLLIEFGVEACSLYETDDSGLSYWCNLVTIICSGSLLSAAATKETSSDADLLSQVNWLKYSRILSALTKNGLNVDHRDNSGSFALSIASKGGHINLVTLLLKCNASVNLKDEESVSSLMQATCSGHLDICRLLLQHYADLNSQDSKGCSALMAAVANSNIDLVLLFLERGAQINLQDESGTSSLMQSCFAGNTHMTKELLQRGADPNLQNSNGVTALMMSSYKGHVETAELLLNYEADPCKTNNDGKTALQLSFDEHHKAVPELLIKYCGNRLHDTPLPLSKGTATHTKESAIIPSVFVTYNTSNSRIESVKRILHSLMLPDNATAWSWIELAKKPVLRDAYMVLCPLSCHWYDIGIRLHVEENTLGEIKLDWAMTKEHLIHMLDRWLRRATPPSTWEELAEAVELFDQRIANKIRGKI